jgi:quercetin dioxygenase-like cupin family protein
MANFEESCLSAAGMYRRIQRSSMVGPKRQARLSRLIAHASNQCPSDKNRRSLGEVMPNFVEVSANTQTIAGEPILYPSTPEPVITSNIVTIEPGAVTPWMVHPVQAYLYVLEGTLTVEFAGEEGAFLEFNAGQAFLPPRTRWHRDRNDGSTPVRYLCVFLGAREIPIMLHPPAREERHQRQSRSDD